MAFPDLSCWHSGLKTSGFQQTGVLYTIRGMFSCGSLGQCVDESPRGQACFG